MPAAAACGGAQRGRGQNKTKSARAVTRAQQSFHQHAARVVVAPPTPTCPPRPPTDAAASRASARAGTAPRTDHHGGGRPGDPPPPLPPRVCVTGRWAGLRHGVRRQAGGWAARRGGGWRRPDTRAPGRGTARVQGGCGGAPVPARARGPRVGAGWRDSAVGGQGAPHSTRRGPQQKGARVAPPA